MAEKKATKELMESHFCGESIVGESKSGKEDFPATRMNVTAKSGAAPADTMIKVKSTKAQNED